MPQMHSDSLSFYAQFINVRKKLSEATASFWSDLEIFSELNRGQAHIAKRTKCLKKTATITTTASTQTYDLNSTTNGFAEIVDISEDGVEFTQNGTHRQPLNFKTIWDLNHNQPGWRGVSASVPIDYYWNKTTKVIGLHAKPNASNAGAYLFVTGYHLPKVLIAGTASSGSTTTMVMPAGSTTVPYPNPTDDYYNDLYVEIYSNTGAGQLMKITDYVASTRTLTFDTATTAIDNTSTFGFIPEIPNNAQYLMELYAMSKLLEKAGSRSSLADRYMGQYIQGVALFSNEFLEDDNESLMKSSYR